MKLVQLFGYGVAGKSYAVTRQRRLNCYYEQRQDSDKTQMAIYGTPGLVFKFSVATPFSTPIRGFLGTQSALYLIAYNQFQSVNATGGVLASGTLNTTAGICSLAFNSNQVVIADGANGYLFLPASNSFSLLPAAFPNGARTVTFVASFFVAEQPGTQQFFVSNANDGSIWSGLAFASASSYSDNILAVDNLSGNLVIFSQQHMEFWQNIGATPQPFAPILSAANEFGLAALFSRGHVNQSIIFLAQTREGQVQFVQVTGFNAAVVSTPDIDSIINGFSTTSDCVALTYETDYHKMYQASFPTANRTFLYDTTTGLWSEAQTGASVAPTRHIGNLSAYFAGQAIISDYQTNQVYTLSPTAYTDNGATIAREVITRHILSDFNRVRISQVYLDMETGVGLASGQGSDPQIMLQYSKDNGRTWSGERWVSIGMMGKYLTRVLWRRFGSTRDATFKFRMTDPVKFVITNGALKIAERPT